MSNITKLIFLNRRVVRIAINASRKSVRRDTKQQVAQSQSHVARTKPVHSTFEDRYYDFMSMRLARH
ncbi:MAG: hypothetical protein Faunusvirus18_12 [Faunusvirus sp.]|uniref:Uncharacterized protein n=1 Tax=Faunusvirus sp. TaxID=2487766 RepID=A0A3G4ZX70_9VIRU|nr:MAG: hypothetical protein Faunusvirus18_12 [Faunusvirus sp.]